MTFLWCTKQQLPCQCWLGLIFPCSTPLNPDLSYLLAITWIVTEKQIPEVKISKTLALKYNILMYLKYNYNKLMKMFGHIKFNCPQRESMSELH